MNGEAPRLHPLLMFLHWLLGLMILGMLALGWLVLAATPNTDPGKVGVLMIHMASGAAILVLTGIRLAVRLSTVRPSPGQPVWTGFIHYSFYAAVFAMITTGFAIAIESGLNLIVFGAPGQPLPASLEAYPSHALHEVLAVILASLIAAHLLLVLYRRFIRGDGGTALGRRSS